MPQTSYLLVEYRILIKHAISPFVLMGESNVKMCVALPGCEPRSDRFRQNMSHSVRKPLHHSGWTCKKIVPITVGGPVKR